MSLKFKKVSLSLFLIFCFCLSAYAQNYAQNLDPSFQNIILSPAQKELLKKELLIEKKQASTENERQLIFPKKQASFDVEAFLTPVRLSLIKQELIDNQGEITIDLIKKLTRNISFQGFSEEEIIKLVVKAKEKLLPELQKDLGEQVIVQKAFPDATKLQVISVALSKTNGTINLSLIQYLKTNPVFQGLSVEQIIDIAIKAKQLLAKEPKEILFQRYIEDKSPQATLEVSTKIKPFGYEIFKKTSPPSLLNKPISPDYIIGPGDEIHILLWGRINEEYTLEVNRDGTIFLPQIGEFVVAGMRYDKMKRFLIKQVKRITGTNAAITMGKLRGIQVLVLGEVQNPGLYNLTPMSTILDALLIAGGPTEIGSLRKIVLKRNGKQITQLDIYELLLKGDDSKDKRLRHGDIVFVPPVGSLVGIAGEVKRPAIYELKNKTNLLELIELAGGLLPSAYLQHIQVERLSNHSKQIILEIDAKDQENLKNFYVQDGDFVKVFSIVKEERNVVYLYGNVRYPGAYAYKPGMKVSDIVKSLDDLLPNTLMDFAVVKRLVPPDNHWEYRSFNLKKVFLEQDPQEDIHLKPYDIVVIYNKWEVMPRKLVTIDGAVNKPGRYEYLPNMKVSDLVALAGGLTRFAYLEEAEIVRRVPSPEGMETRIIKVNLGKALAGDPQENIPLQEEDTLLVKSVPEWEKAAVVEITGEVRFPGKYVIKKGERLSSVLERAGGYTERAYLRGAVFTRKSVQELQQKQINEMIERLERELLVGGAVETGVALTPQEATIKAKEVEAKRQFLARLKQLKAKGRLVIHLKPLDELKGSTDDIELEDGDRLYLPPNPYTVQVVGAVYNQTAFVYRAGKDINYYIDLAGGYTKNADKKEIYILKVDGTAVRLARHLLSLRWNPTKHRWERAFSTTLEPGDTIVVPEKLERVAWLRNVKDITQILYQIAVTVGVIIAAY